MRFSGEVVLRDRGKETHTTATRRKKECYGVGRGGVIGWILVSEVICVITTRAIYARIP